MICTWVLCDVYYSALMYINKLVVVRTTAYTTSHTNVAAQGQVKLLTFAYTLSMQAFMLRR